MVLSLNQPYLILPPLEIAIYINFIQFSCQICRDLRTFHGVNFVLKDLLCVKDMTFCNSGQEEMRKRNEFRSNLERSFESLQKQFQAKVDELERLKRELGHDDNKRRRTSNEIRHTSER